MSLLCSSCPDLIKSRHTCLDTTPLGWNKAETLVAHGGSMPGCGFHSWGNHQGPLSSGLTGSQDR